MSFGCWWTEKHILRRMLECCPMLDTKQLQNAEQDGWSQAAQQGAATRPRPAACLSHLKYFLTVASLPL